MSVKSLICPFEGNEGEMERALKEVDEFSVFEGLDEAKASKLRLISEEIIGMVGNVLDVEDGRFWIEKEESDYKVRFACSTIVGERAKAIFDSASANKEYKGIAGLVRKVIDEAEAMFATTGGLMEMPQAGVTSSGITVGNSDGYEWALMKYEESCERDEKAERWDELELSVIKKMSKDIVISYRNDRFDIIVYADI